MQLRNLETFQWGTKATEPPRETSRVKEFLLRVQLFFSEGQMTAHPEHFILCKEDGQDFFYYTQELFVFVVF